MIHRGHEYLVRAGEVVQDGEPISPRALLHIPARSSLWTWLRAHGIRRPSPSGPSGTHRTDEREAILVRLPRELVTAARARAETTGRTLRALIEEGLRHAVSE